MTPANEEGLTAFEFSEESDSSLRTFEYKRGNPLLLLVSFLNLGGKLWPAASPTTEANENFFTFKNCSEPLDFKDSCEGMLAVFQAEDVRYQGQTWKTMVPSLPTGPIHGRTSPESLEKNRSNLTSLQRKRRLFPWQIHSESHSRKPLGTSGYS